MSTHRLENNFAVLNVDFEPEPRSNAGGTIGIDVGIKAFYSDSNGNTVSNPRYLERSMRKLIREQRRLSRKQKDSHNREKQRIRVARVYEKVTNQRNDFLQKQSTMLVRENQTICIEDLNVKGMIRNHKLSKSIASVSWAKFFLKCWNIKLAGMEMKFTEYQRCIRAVRPAAVVATEIHG